MAGQGLARLQGCIAAAPLLVGVPPAAIQKHLNAKDAWGCTASHQELGPRLHGWRMQHAIAV
jgi:hypothetical protein